MVTFECGTELCIKKQHQHQHNRNNFQQRPSCFCFFFSEISMHFPPGRVPWLSPCFSLLEFLGWICHVRKLVEIIPEKQFI